MCWYCPILPENISIQSIYLSNSFDPFFSQSSSSPHVIAHYFSMQKITQITLQSFKVLIVLDNINCQDTISSDWSSQFVAPLFINILQNNNIFHEVEIDEAITDPPGTDLVWAEEILIDGGEDDRKTNFIFGGSGGYLLIDGSLEPFDIA